MDAISFDNIRAAAGRIDAVFLNSPTATADSLDAALGCQVVAKVELANPVGSFKGRGTEYLAATALAAGEPVTCASAGNFGQGLARAATRRGHACTVFAAETANPVKIDAMRRLGAQVRLAGRDFDAAKQAAREYARFSGSRYIEDGAEPAIAEGAGTIALELLANERFDTILVQLGNGALLAGVGTVLRRLAARTQIVAVVAENAPAMKLSLEAHRAVETPAANTMADGMAVRVPIAATLPLLAQCCDEVVSVSEAQMMAAMRLIRGSLELTVEPSGAAGIAAILREPRKYAGRRVATILSGGNISQELLQQLQP